MVILGMTLKSGAKDAVSGDAVEDFKEIMDAFVEGMTHVYALPGGTFAVRLSEVVCMSIVDAGDPESDQDMGIRE